MILSKLNPDSFAAATIDDVFQHALARRPDMLAFIDPPNRTEFADGAALQLTYAEADRIITAIASKLRQIGLGSDDVVAFQLGNTIEHVLTLLAIIRSGMIAAPLPLLWRRAEVTDALRRIEAKAIVASSRIGDHAACELAVEVAAEVFTIRHVCGFGDALPDGVIGFDSLMSEPAPTTSVAPIREGEPAAHLALITFEVTTSGIVPVPRSHAELIGGGLAVLLEGSLPSEVRLVGCMALASFGALAMTVLPCLLNSGTLSLHHGFDEEALATQLEGQRCDAIAIPGALLWDLAAAHPEAISHLQNVLAAWRSPERWMQSAPCTAFPLITDVLMFGEAALVGSRRDTKGQPVPLSAEGVRAPRGARHPVRVADFSRSEQGTLKVRGPMIPTRGYFTTAEGPPYEVDAEGYYDTLYPCRLDPNAGALTVTGPPSGAVDIGGYRFRSDDIEAVNRQVAPSGMLVALPDVLLGHRLAGFAANGSPHTLLTGLGVNALIETAVRGKST